MDRNHLSVTSQIAKAALQLSICFRITKRSTNQKDRTSAATATKNSWGLQL